MAEFDHNINMDNGEESVDIKKIIFLVIHNWYWFLLFGILGSGLAFIYTQVSKQKYQASTSILLKDNTGGINVSDLFQGAINQPKNNVTDQMEIISSYDVINKALKSLNWRTSWFQKNLWAWDEMYKNTPFVVSEDTGFKNPENGKIYITPVSKTKYKIRVSDEFNSKPNRTDIEINAMGTFGQPFHDKYFHFTISLKDKNADLSGSEYYFVFNNLASSTLKYRNLIQTSTLNRNNQSNVIICSIKGQEPQKEVDFLNKLISTYIQEKLHMQNETQRKTLDFIDSQLKEISDSLNKASNSFISFRAKNKIIDLTQAGTMVLDSLAHIESEKANLQLRLGYYNNLQQYLKNPGNSKIFAAPSVVGIKDGLFNALVLQMNELYNKKTVLDFSAKNNNPALILLNQQISHTRKQLEVSVSNMIRNANQYLSIIKARESLVTQKLMKLPKKEQQMITLQNKYNMINQIYTFLLQNKAQTSITMASNVPDVQVIDVARLETTTPVGTVPKMIIIIGFILGLIVPGLFILIRNYFDDRIRSQEDVENHTQLPILANIIHSPGYSDLAIYDNPKSSLSESFRTMRTNLQFMLDSKGGNVISIHSTNPSEGKSFISTNLATILAMNNKSVILIGADLRKPRLHKVFDVSNDKGLSTYLIGQNTIEEIIQSTKIKNLSLLASGPIPPNPAEILGKPEMKTLIDDLRKRFDYIIIDNAPIALVTDGIITSRLSDVNIFILRYGNSKRHNLEFINQEVARKTIDKVALVVNDIKTGSFGYSYYKDYNYEYYQKSYYGEEEKKDRKKRKKMWNK